LREHLFELSGFKERVGEARSARLTRGESIQREEFPPILKLTLGLREHPPYECLKTLEFRVISCDRGVVVLATDPERQPTQARLFLNFPAETLEFDLEGFSYNSDHWEFDNKLGESYYQFLWDYYGNGCLEVFDCLSGERVSHKMAFIPMNVDFRKLELHLEIKRCAYLRGR
jgi:hypothetical protein